MNKLITLYAVYVHCMGEKSCAYRDLVGKFEGKGELGIPTRR
jgi:hypothetical protein